MTEAKRRAIATYEARIRIHEATIAYSKSAERRAEAARLLDADRAALAALVR